MAHKTPLASWLYSKRQELNPRFREFNWPGKFLPGVFDFSTTIVWNGIESEGRGVDFSREIALEKSVAEAIERLICKSKDFGSVGFAVAGSYNPISHARFEALERYFLDFHINNKIPFRSIDDGDSVSGQFKSINSSADISFFRMATSEELFGVICSITSKKQSRSLGFALSDSLETSLRRSMLEALPNYAWLVEESANGTHGSEAMPWHIDSQFMEKIEPLLQSTEVSLSEKDIIKQPQLQESKVNFSDISILKNAPIQTARFTIQEGDWA